MGCERIGKHSAGAWRVGLGATFAICYPDNRKTMTARLFHAFLVLTVILSAVNAILLLSENRQDPITGPLLTEALNSPVRAGEHLFVRITREKVRSDCPVTSVRNFVSEDGAKAPGGIAVRQAGGLPNAAFVDWKYPVPPTLTPGRYELRVALRYDCPRGLTFYHDQEPVPFRVVP